MTFSFSSKHDNMTEQRVWGETQILDMRSNPGSQAGRQASTHVELLKAGSSVAGVTTLSSALNFTLFKLASLAWTQGRQTGKSKKKKSLKQMCLRLDHDVTLIKVM